MNLIPKPVPKSTKDTDMETFKKNAVHAALELRATYAIGLLLLFATAALWLSYEYQHAPLLTWVQTKLWMATGFRPSHVYWFVSLLFCFATIVFWRPEPKVAYILALPLLIYGGLAVWYGIETGAIPYTVLALMLWGFAVTPLLVAALTGLGAAMKENYALQKDLAYYKAYKERYEALLAERGTATDADATHTDAGQRA